MLPSQYYGLFKSMKRNRNTKATEYYDKDLTKYELRVKDDENVISAVLKGSDLIVIDSKIADFSGEERTYSHPCGLPKHINYAIMHGMATRYRESLQFVWMDAKFKRVSNKSSLDPYYPIYMEHPNITFWKVIDNIIIGYDGIYMAIWWDKETCTVKYDTDAETTLKNLRDEFSEKLRAEGFFNHKEFIQFLNL